MTSIMCLVVLIASCSGYLLDSGELDLERHKMEMVPCPDLSVFEIGNLSPACQKIVRSGKPISITCNGTDPIEFVCPTLFDAEAKEEISVCINSSRTLRREFGRKYKFTLTIDFARHFHTGMYTCQTKTSNSSLYIFVEDESRLLLPMKPVYYMDEINSTIPCKPTHPNVRVHLYHNNSSGGHPGKQSKLGVFDLLHEEADAEEGIIKSMWTYDPKRGFRLTNSSQTFNVPGYYECRADRVVGSNTVKYGVKFQVLLSVGKNSDEAPSSNDKSEFNDYVLIISSGIIFLGIMIIIFGLAVTKIFTEESSSVEDGLPIDPRWEFPRCRLNLLSQLEFGSFGSIIKAEATGIRSDEPATAVVAKTNRWNGGIQALITELKIFVHIGRHLNVVSFLGACTENRHKHPLFIITEYCPFNNLRKHLITFRRRYVNQVDECGFLVGSALDDGQQHYDGTIRNSFITTRDLIYWAYQICRGMVFLVSKNVLHRDLALRNILLADNNIIKISDFGLSRINNADDGDFHQEHNQGMLPIKWMSIEAVVSGIYSSQSDVWSFGVVLWELFTLGKVPYGEMPISYNYMMELLQAGHRLKKPRNAPRFLGQLMSSCWNKEPIRRPTFGEMENSLRDQLDTSVFRRFTELDDKFMEITEKPKITGASLCCGNAPTPQYISTCP